MPKVFKNNEQLQCYSPPFFWGDNFQSKILELGGPEKMSASGDVKSSSYRYLPGELSMFLILKKTS